ncbi:MAG: hypothetical protein H0U46_07865 [Actinobacteria bacterium]|nr:hypothetical protein [Actinomycetota bacterium]
MGIASARAPVPLIQKISFPAIAPPAALAIATRYATTRNEKTIAVPVASASAARGNIAFSQRTIYPIAAAGSATGGRPVLSQATPLVLPATATASRPAPVPLVRVIGVPTLATASRTPPKRMEIVAAPAIASDFGLRTIFAGPDESPLSDGGVWTALASDHVQLARIGSALKRTGAGTGRSSRLYNTSYSDVEAGVLLASNFPSSGSIGVLARVQGEGGVNIYDGYLAYIDATTVKLYRTTNSADTFLGSSGTIAFTALGTWLKIVCRGTRIEAWYKPPGGVWTLAAGVTDATYASGKIGVIFFNPTSSLPEVKGFFAQALSEPVVRIDVPTPARLATAARTPPAVVIS